MPEIRRIIAHDRSDARLTRRRARLYCARHVTSAEYRALKTPRIKAAFAQHRKLRVLWLMGNDFRGFEIGAMGQDITLGLRHWRGWQRIALVTDVASLRAFARATGWMLPCEFRLFPLARLDEAKCWIAEGL